MLNARSGYTAAFTSESISCVNSTSLSSNGAVFSNSDYDYEYSFHDLSKFIKLLKVSNFKCLTLLARLLLWCVWLSCLNGTTRSWRPFHFLVFLFTVLSVCLSVISVLTLRSSSTFLIASSLIFSKSVVYYSLIVFLAM